ncbi:helix-turn-helix transcriptional regulator [Streptomyces sp. H10-C2]|uniref:helix-turn-helix transcriptional regulator n=1 Tax=unclassified Streptomyces TaxID=2593676 RepID=UPI0024BB5D1C|nr:MULTISPECIES: helix-turn-helix transcriptional regulator [unclassified Streptomyces]MDJ0340725.1 helix-turn-helix transcriptional regulator [Streptomyces sp. PH10-H1]MDJ0372003.1 helix-turn-helix transcriptional regulator [Streptomyces sp. H10-C2]
MYRERSSRVAGAVLWTRTVGAGDGGPYRVLPDGCMDVIWSDGQLIVTGPDTRAHVAETPAGARFAGLRFAPGTGPGVLGVPAYELRDLRVPLDALWPGGTARRIAERIDDAADPGTALEEAVAGNGLGYGYGYGQGREAGTADPLPAATAARLASGGSVASVAKAAGLGERQLHRRCLAAFGYGPKMLARVLRLQRALELARRGTPFAEVAVVAGYADQAHLAREVKALAGVPLGELIR